MLPKRAYNAVHPFTSFIPIFCYMVLRNCSPTLRRYHMHLFAWCGKVTLETYILQFHIWMKTTGINGIHTRLPHCPLLSCHSPCLLLLPLPCPLPLHCPLPPPLPPTIPPPSSPSPPPRHPSLLLPVAGSPKFLMVWLPGWFYTNFLLTSIVFFFVSYRIFKITVTLRDACIPRDGSRMVHNSVAMVAGVLALYGCGLGLKS